MSCLDENKVVEFIQGLLAPEARAVIEAHLDDCASCRKLMAEVARLSLASSSTIRVGSTKREDEEDTLPPLSSDGSASLRTPAGSRELIPDQVLAGRFRIVRRIGRGSFGNVYEAEDLQLKERVALKLLRREVRENPGMLGHLHHEIVVGRRVSHPNVCRIYDLGTCGEIHFISMALVRGEGLDRLLEKGLPPPPRALEILLQICDALEAAHHQGVVHRDLKPSNIMVQEEGEAISITVMDFGLSRDLRAGPSMSGALIGSPAYWSPEQARGDRATARSDLYSLGLIGCDLFGVKHPAFGASGGLEAIPPDFRAVIERCLRASPELRFGSAQELRKALTLASRRARGRRRLIRTVVVAGLAAVGGGALAVLLLLHLRGPATTLPVAADAGARTAAWRDSGVGAGSAARGRALDAASAPAVTSEKVTKIVRRPGKRSPVGVAPPVAPLDRPRPDAAVRSAPAVPVEAAALAETRERLGRLEAERRRRGILIDDMASARSLREEIRRGLAASRLQAARGALERFEESLRQVKIDHTFVKRKVDGLNRAKTAVKLPEATKQQVDAISKEVHLRFFSGDFEGANAQLNRMWQLLGRAD